MARTQSTRGSPSTHAMVFRRLLLGQHHSDAAWLAYLARSSTCGARERPRAVRRQPLGLDLGHETSAATSGRILSTPHSIASRASSRLATNPSPPALAETRGALWWAIALHRARGPLPSRPPRRSFAPNLRAGLLLAPLVMFYPQSLWVIEVVCSLCSCPKCSEVYSYEELATLRPRVSTDRSQIPF